MTDMIDQKLNQIVTLIQNIGNISELGAEDDFYDAGFSSIKALELLLELETVFSVSIPDDSFVEMRTPRSIAELITTLTEENA